MRQYCNMSTTAFFSLLSFLLVVTAARDFESEKGVVMANSAATVTAYWQEMLPHSPLPSSILELLNPIAIGEVHHGVYNGYNNGYRNSNEKIYNGYSNGYRNGNGEAYNGYNNGYRNGNEKVYNGYSNGYRNGNGKVYNGYNNGYRNGNEKVYNGYSNSYGTGNEKVYNGYSNSYRNGNKKVYNGYSNGYRNGGEDITMAPNLHFLEDTLKPGTVVDPYIMPVATRAPFVPRDLADTIPMSTHNFANIVEMFAPVSPTMADGIRSALNTCENLRPIEGEEHVCATSIESMVEFATSVLGTRGIRAFSPDVPAKGVTPGSSKYKVAAVRTVAGSRSDTMTCHTMKFPYAVFYCHAINPTRVYAVALESEDDGEKMEALAVCHLETSRFDPKTPLFVKNSLKPGDASVCHFISRDSVLWASVDAVTGMSREDVHSVATA